MVNVTHELGAGLRVGSKRKNAVQRIVLQCALRSLSSVITAAIVSLLEDSLHVIQMLLGKGGPSRNSVLIVSIVVYTPIVMRGV